MSNFGEIWKKLSSINLTDLTEKKGNLTFLSWANGWQKLMEHYPESHFEVCETPTYYSDGSAEVWVSVTVEGNTRKMWLPVMDNRNNSILNPTSRQVSDARMRCLVKCLGLFGLGLYIYQGEDLPREVESDVVSILMQHLDAEDFVGAHQIWVKCDQEKVFSSFPKGDIVKYKKLVRSMVDSVNDCVDQYVLGIRESVSNDDTASLVEYKQDMESNIKKLVASKLTSQELLALKEAKLTLG